MENYGEWDMTIPALPARSRLYSLEPVGIGSPYTESLTSYTIRLAELHHVSLKDLVTQEIFPLLGKAYLSSENPYIHATWHRDALILNGTGSHAKAWGEVLAQLTLWDNFSSLTMLIWHDVISRKGLLRSAQAWCPECYEEWRKNRSQIYMPLLWTLKAVDICPRHYIYLQHLCPYEDCRRSLPYFSLRTRLGYCSYCMRWLGSSSLGETPDRCNEALIRDGSQQYWISKSVGEIIEIAPHLLASPKKDQIALFLTQCSNQLADGSLKLLARRLDIYHVTLLEWQQEANTPRLDTILKVCYALDISLSFFLSGNAYNWSQYSNIQPIRRSRHRKIAKEEVCRMLEGFLIENPPLSLHEITAKLGYNSPGHLYWCSSELCRAITARHRQWCKENQVSRRSPRPFENKGDVQKFLEELLGSDKNPLPSIRQIGIQLGYRDGRILHRHFSELSKAISEKRQQQILDNPLKRILEDILANSSDPPLSLNEIARNLGYPVEYLYNHFPGLCRAIVKKYEELFDVEALKFMLETVLSDGTNPPPSVHELAKQFGFDVARLRRQFPDLCAKIAKNYRIYRKALGAMRVQRIYEDVKDTVMLLSTQGCYPSITKVREILFEKKYWIKDVNDAWRKVMLELGFDDCAEQNL